MRRFGTPYVLITRVHDWCGVVTSGLTDEKQAEFERFLEENEVPTFATSSYAEIPPDFKPRRAPPDFSYITRGVSFLTTHEAAVLIALRFADFVHHQDVEDLRTARFVIDTKPNA